VTPVFPLHTRLPQQSMEQDAAHSKVRPLHEFTAGQVMLQPPALQETTPPLHVCATLQSIEQRTACAQSIPSEHVPACTQLN